MSGPLHSHNPVSSSAFFQKVDVTKWDEQVALFIAAKALVPRIDYVFVNAGVSFDGLLLHPDNQPAEFVPPTLTVLDINLYGMVYSTNLAVQLLRAQEVVDGFRGKIVVTASLAYVSHLAERVFFRWADAVSI